MQATIRSKRKDPIKIEFDGTESGLFQAVGKEMVSFERPQTFTIFTDDGFAEIELKENGIGAISYNIEGLKRSRYDRKWLTKVTNRSAFFYKIIPHNMGDVTVSIGGSYGTIGADKTDLGAEKVFKHPNQTYLFWLKYYDHIQRGYVDQSDVLFKDRADELKELMNPFGEKDKGLVEKAKSVAQELFLKLKDAATDALAEQMDEGFLKKKPYFTRRQVNESWEAWKKLGKAGDVEEFNKIIRLLITLCPRKIDPYKGLTVSKYFAKTKDDFADIVAREESLIMAMEALVKQDSSSKVKKGVQNEFPNTLIRMATDTEKEEVMQMFEQGKGRHLKENVLSIYRVIDGKQSKKFEEYIKKRGIKETKLLWHGSRSENWISIIRNSLMLNPNAVITGKAFGYGIYFALDTIKSWGYTSAHGSKWANGRSNSAYMGLYETAYGNPFFPEYRAEYDDAFLKEHGKDCVHAKAGIFMMDEIIFYDEAAVNIKYLVEFKG